MSIPYLKDLRQAYGFDDVAIVPGTTTLNPDMTDIQLQVGELTFELPILAAAMDAVVDPQIAITYSRMGGLAVLNLEGLQCRFDEPREILQRVAAADKNGATAILQEAYRSPVRDDLVAQRIQEIRKGGGRAAVAATPAKTKQFAPVAEEAGAEIFVVQSTVTTARHISHSLRGLILSELVNQVSMPVIVGNTVSYQGALELFREGIAGLLVGVGPGAACTSREVLGVGVPQVTATVDGAAARDKYYADSGRYVPIITDGGIRTGGDMCKAFVAGADAVMLGSPFAGTAEAPGGGFHWGMATAHADLPRGVRVEVGQRTTLQRLLFGPTSRTNGSENLAGALRTCMAMVGARNIREMHQAEMVIAPAIKTEGKLYQLSQ